MRVEVSDEQSGTSTVPSVREHSSQRLLLALREIQVGGEDASLPSLQKSSLALQGLPTPESKQAKDLALVQGEEALDARFPTALADAPDRYLGWDTWGPGVCLAVDAPLLLARAAAAQERVRAATDVLAVRVGMLPSQLGDSQAPTSLETRAEDKVGDALFRITHYFGARVPTGDGGGYNAPMACEGEMPDAGAAAGIREYCGRRFSINGIEFVFKDTGASVGPRNIDIFCASLECWDWACTKRCPEFADWETIRWLSPKEEEP